MEDVVQCLVEEFGADVNVKTNMTNASESKHNPWYTMYPNTTFQAGIFKVPKFGNSNSSIAQQTSGYTPLMEVLYLWDFTLILTLMLRLHAEVQTTWLNICYNTVLWLMHLTCKIRLMQILCFLTYFSA
jgi:hypothetical protein